MFTNRILGWARLSASACCLAVLGFAGCSKPEGPLRVPVAGLVSLDGNPLPTGSIRFIPTGKSKGPAAVGEIIDGEFELTEEDGPIIGSHRVEIDVPNAAELDDDQAFARRIEQGQPRSEQPSIPPSYNRRSILVVQIGEEGEFELNFPLQSNGAAP